MMIAAPDSLAVTLTRNAQRIERLAGHQPCALFRPHAGWRSGSMYEALDRMNYRLVGWSWGLWDWNWYRPREARRLASRLASKASPGDIVVMHDGHHVNPSAGRQYAVEATRCLISALRAKGYGFGTLCSG
jgi:peptidoglycan/xylan/chitin deacetylase (PgdA/CDA1 family)